MKVCKLAAAAAVAGCWTAAQAAVMVTNVTVQQRWPWNGKVDIDYEVLSDDPDDSIFVYPEAKENDRNIAIAPRTLSGEGVEEAMCGARVKPGLHRMTWHMDEDEPTLHSSSFTVTMHAVKGGMYLVVDLSAGPNAESYPIRYSDTPPDITDDACRTTNLWLRLCLPGTFMMGSPSDEEGRETSNWDNSSKTKGKETLHQVTLTKPFYIGVFEVTQRQYSLIRGSNPSAGLGDLLPVNTVTYNGLRGSVAGAAWPQHSQVDPSSFFGVLRAKTGCLFDLPTEAQWEYACRAGTSTAYNNGKSHGSVNCKEVARCYDNRSNTVNGFSYQYQTVVGQYKPNAWGLYDMHGNVAERCLDWWKSDLGKYSVIDPVGGETSVSQITVYTDGGVYYSYTPRVTKGGSAGKTRSILGSTQNCRSAARHAWYHGDPAKGDQDVGFRVVATPVVQ